MAVFPRVELFYDFHSMEWADHPNLAQWREMINLRPGVQRSRVRYREIAAQDPTFSGPPLLKTLDMVLGRGKLAGP
jgi:hypothetical protein